VPEAREIIEKLKEIRMKMKPRPTNSRCEEKKDDYGNVRARIIVDDNDRVLYAVGIPEYIKYYPYILDNVYYILESGKIIKWFNLDNGESFCYEMTFEELIEELKEELKKAK